ncbi:MAG: hypothetical protein IJD37_07725 [Clostridia bacterium]|nr:hypothetical protein [Clostridia bacterium]
MTVLHNVYGSFEHTAPLIISGDTVFIHTDVEKVDKNEFGEPCDNLYTYTETQYSKDEYILLLSQKNNSLEEQMTDTHLALCELYEMFSQ